MTQGDEILPLREILTWSGMGALGLYLYVSLSEPSLNDREEKWSQQPRDYTNSLILAFILDDL